jgi:hypothetical protein
MDSHPGAAVGALAWRAFLRGLSLVDRHLKLVRIVLGVPALGALDAHPDDYGDIVHTDKRATCVDAIEGEAEGAHTDRRSYQ